VRLYGLKGFMRSASLTATIAIVGLLGACGGGDEQPPTADVQRLATCLRGKGFSAVTTSESKLDKIAAGAGVGGVQFLADSNEIQIAAERSESDAEDTQQKAEASGLSSVERIGTVVVAYNKTPSPEESSPVHDCLGEQGIE
jgi:hypothetical protein